MRSIAPGACALVLASLAVLAARADDEPDPLAYSKEWGPNLAGADRGGRVVELSSNATSGDQTLIDNAIGEGHYWQPDWQRGFPCWFSVSLPRAERIGRLQLTHRPDGVAAPKEIEVWLGTTRENLRLALKVTLPNARTQTAELEPREASLVKIVVKASHQEGQIEVGEVALFGAPLGGLRGSDTKDVLELRQGDRLLGELASETFTMRGRLGELRVKREDLVSLALDDPKDGLDRAFLRNGEVSAGELLTARVSIKIEGDTVVEVARDRLRGIGLKRAKGDFPEKPDELLKQGHVLLLADGTRALGKAKLDPVTLRGACGEVSVPLDAVQTIEVGRGAEPFDRVLLRTGDVLRGVLLANEVPFQPTAGTAPIKLPKACVSKLLLALEPEQPGTPSCDNQRIVLKTGEVVSGTLAVERLRIAAGYASVDIDPTSIDHAEPLEGGRLRVTLRDGGVVHGRPDRDPLPFDLDAGGGKLLVPIDRLERIDNYRLSKELSKRIDDLVKKLDGEWNEREGAQAELVKIGRAALARLGKVIRDGSPEAKARAAAAANEIRANQEPDKPAAPAGPPVSK